MNDLIKPSAITQNKLLKKRYFLSQDHKKELAIRPNRNLGFKKNLVNTCSQASYSLDKIKDCII